jgi:hypothetical protein
MISRVRSEKLWVSVMIILFIDGGRGELGVFGFFLLGCVQQGGGSYGF